MSTRPKTLEEKIEILLSINDMTERNLCEIVNEDYKTVRPALVRLENAKKIKAKVVDALIFYTLINKR